MNPLYFAIIAAPIGVYLFIIGLVNLKRRPFVTTGSRDAAAIGIAISGLMIAGPMELFFPESAAGRFGPYVWVLLLAFYGLCVSLIVLLMRPRIVVYNLGPQSLRPLLGDVAIRLDPKARWSGDSLWLPTLNVQLNLEGSSWLSNSQLVSVGDKQRFEGWRMLEKELGEQVSAMRSETVVFGVALIASAAALGLTATVWIVAEPLVAREALANLLRL